jgi:hypothetical protein
MTAPSILTLIQKKKKTLVIVEQESGISKGEHYLPKHLPSTTEEK